MKKAKHHQKSSKIHEGNSEPPLCRAHKPGMFVFDLSIFRPQCALEFFGCRWVWRRDLKAWAQQTRLSTAFCETVTLSGTRLQIR